MFVICFSESLCSFFSETRKRKLIRPIMNGDWAGDPSLSASSVLGSGDSSRNSSMLANQITVSYGGAQGNYFVSANLA